MDGTSEARTWYRISPARPRPGIIHIRPAELGVGQLGMLSLHPLRSILRRWWLARQERHFLICAEQEEHQARQAYLNASWYQKQATLARLAKAELR